MKLGFFERYIPDESIVFDTSFLTAEFIASGCSALNPILYPKGPHPLNEAGECQRCGWIRSTE